MPARLRPVVRAFLEAALPASCLLCGDAGGAVPNLCRECARELPWIRHRCRRCGIPLAADALCPACLHAAPSHLSRAALGYHGTGRYLLHALKFHGRLDAAAALGAVLSTCLAADPPRLPQALIPIPLHPARFRARGFNQATEIAREVSRSLGIALRTDLLERGRSTPPQTEMSSAAARRRNVRGAFRLRILPAGLSRVALVDDVMTTGATTREVVRLLRKAGVTQVETWVCARAVTERDQI